MLWGTRVCNQAGMSPGNRPQGRAQISCTCPPASRVPKGRGGAGRGRAGTACLPLLACLPGLSHSAVPNPAGGPWSLGPQATGDKGQIPWPWLWAIDPAQAGWLGVGRPWPGQTEAPGPVCRPGTHLPLPKVSGGLQDRAPRSMNDPGTVSTLRAGPGSLRLELSALL